MSPDPFPGSGPADPGLNAPGKPPAEGNGTQDRAPGLNASAGHRADGSEPEDDWDADAHLEAVIAAADAGEYELPEWSVEDLPAEFIPGGTADLMGPGPVLAALVHAAIGRDGAALAAGQIHPVHVLIIADETAYVSPDVGAEADEVLAQAAQSKTFSQLRYKAHRLVLRFDPDSARRRKEEAKKDAHVRRFRESSGNAGMVAREMPWDEILASWQHVEQRALDLRAAGPPGSLPAGSGPPGTGPPGSSPPDSGPPRDGDPPGPPGPPSGGGPPGPLKPPGTPDPQVTDFLRSLNVTLNPVIRGPCDHSQAEDGYRPSRKLQHLVNARNPRCSAPGCGRPAARCDLDHSTPWDEGGLTCSCNLAPLCRHHHRLKQAEGWRLEQPEPGVLVWWAPTGLSYRTTPAAYPM